jgi:hypothetical protein
MDEKLYHRSENSHTKLHIKEMALLIEKNRRNPLRNDHAIQQTC